MIVGAVGPWAMIPGSGVMSGSGGHGWIVIAAALVGTAGLCAYVWRRWVALGCLAVLCGGGAAVASCVALYELVSTGWAGFLAHQSHLASPGWGVFTDAAGSVAFAVLVCALMVWWRPTAVAPVRSLIPAAAAAPPSEPWERTASSGASRPFLTVGNVAAMVFIVVGMGVVVVTRIHNRHHAAVTVSSAPSRAVARAPSIAVKNASNRTAPPHVSAQAVKQFLDEYVAAYSAENPGRILQVLAPSLIRRDGSSSPQDLHHAMAVYRAQF